MSQWSSNSPSQNNTQVLLGYWNLLISLVSRDIRTRYRRTVLGPLWAIIPAILSTVIYSFLGSVVNVDTAGVPQVVFTFAATVPWTFFQSIVVRIPHGVLSNGNLLRKMPVPRQIFPLVVIFIASFDFLMSFVVLAVTLQLFGVAITAAWLWLPLLVLMTVALGSAFGIFISAFTIYRRDLLHGLRHIMQVWLVFTPVIYGSGALESNLQIAYQLNPAVGIIDGFRRVLVFGQPPDLGLLATSLIVTCLVMAAAYPLYSHTSRYFADVA